MVRPGSGSLLSILAIVALLALNGCGKGGETTTDDATSSQANLKSLMGAAKNRAERAYANATPRQKHQLDKLNQAVHEIGHSSGPSQKKQSASGAAAFEAKGADNSIQESGSEAPASELDSAATALHGYLDARAAADWGKACSFMASPVAASLSQLTGEKGSSCAKTMKALSAGLPAAALKEAAIAEVGALRVKGDSAFLLFHGAHGSDYFIPMAREGSAWRVAAIAASPLQ